MNIDDRSYIKNSNSSKVVIPDCFRGLFWDADFDLLDYIDNKDYVITRLLKKGGIRGMAWVFNTYTEAQIIDTACKSRNLDPILANYLMQKYKLNKEDMAYYRLVQEDLFDVYK